MSGREPDVVFGGLVLGVALVSAGAVASVLLSSVWPVAVTAVVVAVCAGPMVLAMWRERGERSALRRARRRVAREHQPLGELRGMVGTSPASLREVVRALCEKADAQGQALLIEVDEDDRMRPAWCEEGFEERERVETGWGGVILLVRRPR